MHETNLIVTLTGALAVGLALGYITNYLRLSPIVGYLIAGIVIGPNTPGFIADQNLAHQLAEIGVMLLMFGVGLHFHLEDLWSVRKIAIPGAIIQILVATILGALTAWMTGWGLQSGIVYGLCLSVASTVVLTRILVDNKQLHTPTGIVAVGWLIVEDLFTVLVLVILPVVMLEQGSNSSLPSAIVWLVFKLLILVLATFVLGMRAIPWLFTKVAKTRSQELFTLTVLVTALGIAVVSAKLFDVSMALGAFLAGMVVGKSDFSLRAASEVLPLRDAFAVLFFVSVGMLLDPSILIDHFPLILTTFTVVLIGKTLAAFLIVLILGYPLKVALGVSIALAQIGEFSFILASLGKQLGLLNDIAINALVATSILSITVNPILFRAIPYVDRWINRQPKLASIISLCRSRNIDTQSQDHNLPSPDFILIGYGPIGQAISRILKENLIRYTVIELNLETTQNLKSKEEVVIYGDASKNEILESAGISEAHTLIITSSSITNPGEIVQLAKILNPKIQIIARTTYAREMQPLKHLGCDTVFSGEGEVALTLIEDVLSRLGLSKEQISRERLRVREEIVNLHLTT